MSPVGTAVEKGITLKQNQFKELNLRARMMQVGWLRRLMPEATEATMVIGKLLGRCNVPALADPTLQILGQGARSSRPRDKGDRAV